MLVGRDVVRCDGMDNIQRLLMWGIGEVVGVGSSGVVGSRGGFGFCVTA